MVKIDFFSKFFQKRNIMLKNMFLILNFVQTCNFPTINYQFEHTCTKWYLLVGKFQIWKKYFGIDGLLLLNYLIILKLEKNTKKMDLWGCYHVPFLIHSFIHSPRMWSSCHFSLNSKFAREVECIHMSVVAKKKKHLDLGWKKDEMSKLHGASTCKQRNLDCFWTMCIGSTLVHVP